MRIGKILTFASSGENIRKVSSKRKILQKLQKTHQNNVLSTVKISVRKFLEIHPTLIPKKCEKNPKFEKPLKHKKNFKKVKSNSKIVCFSTITIARKLNLNSINFINPRYFYFDFTNPIILFEANFNPADLLVINP